MNKLLDEFAFQLEMDVDWGDMDALQHVNNVEYFKYFQKARIAYFEKNISKKWTFIFNAAFNFSSRGQSVCQIE